jgi:hypothetical protein
LVNVFMQFLLALYGHDAERCERGCFGSEDVGVECYAKALLFE